MSVNDRYKFTIEHYVMELIKEVKEKKYMYLVNVSVDINYRSRKIGTNLLTYFIKQMHEAGFEEIGLGMYLWDAPTKFYRKSLT